VSGGKALKLGPFTVTEERDLNFCYYRATQQAVIDVSAVVEGDRKIELFKSRTIDLQPHQWMCDKVPLQKGDYDSVSHSFASLFGQRFIRYRFNSLPRTCGISIVFSLSIRSV
jgi:hypothetical protein